VISIQDRTWRQVEMTHNEEHCLRNESGLAWGESGEGETHESNVKPVTGQFEFPQSNLATVRGLENI
jgi:hypothetical protein